MKGVIPETQEEMNEFFTKMKDFKYVYPSKIDLSWAKEKRNNMKTNVSEAVEEYLKEEGWTSAEDTYPEVDGEYMVKMHTGSMSPKVIEMKSNYRTRGNGTGRFNGEGDWNYVQYWRKLKDGE